MDNRQSFREQLHEYISKQIHAGFLTDPAEEEMLQICGEFAVQWCRHVRKKIREVSKLEIPSVTFFSYHPRFNIVVAWAAIDTDRRDPDMVLGDAAKVDILRQRGRYVPQPDLAGLSTLFLSGKRENVLGVYVRPFEAECVKVGDSWRTEKAGRKAGTLDPLLAKALGVADRVYLPVGPHKGAWSGAFMVALPAARVRRKNWGQIMGDEADKLIAAYHKWTKKADIILATFPIVHPVWETLWESTRESRTLLPHQASFKRVLARILQRSFWEGRQPFIGIAHFDFNDFKRLNDLAGYDGADHVAELFVKQACNECSKLSNSVHPVSVYEHAWSALHKGRQGPGVAWFFSRIGGDEFGLVYVSEKSTVTAMQRCIQAAVVTSTTKLINSIKRGDLARAASQWKLRCMGAHLELRVQSLVRRATNPEYLSDVLWRFVTRLSQQVKVDFKTEMGNEVYLSRTFEEALVHWEKAHKLEVRMPGTPLRGAFNLPFVEFPEYADDLPFLKNVETLGVDKRSRIALCRRKA